MLPDRSILIGQKGWKTPKLKNSNTTFSVIFKHSELNVSILEEKYIFSQICIFFLNLHALWMQLSNVTYELPAKKFTKLFTKLFCQEKSKTRKSTFKSFQEVFLLRFCSFSDWQTDFRLNMYVHFRHVQRRKHKLVNN